MNLNLKSKLLFLSIIPLLFVIVLSSIILFELFDNKKNLELTKYRILEAEAISKVIHYMQIERGMTAGFIASEYLNSKDDKLLSAMDDLDKAIDEAKFIFLHISQNSSSHILDVLESIRTNRKSIYLLNMSISDAKDYYTKNITTLLNFIKTIPTTMNTKENRTLIAAYNDLSTAKEALGQIRATLNEVFTTNKFSDNLFLSFAGNLEIYKSNSDDFKLILPAELLTFHNNNFNHPAIEETFQMIRDAVKNRGSRNFNTSASLWFEKATESINLLKKTEDELFKHVTKSINERLDSIFYKIALLIFSLTVTAVLITILMVFVIRKILSSTSMLEKEYGNSLLLLEQYKTTVEKSFIVTKTDAKGIITYVNGEFCKISGYSKEELLGKPHNIVRHPDTPKEIFKSMWHTIKELKEPWSGEIQNRNKNGTSYWVKAIINPIMNSNGKVVEHICIRSNITEIKEASNIDFMTGYGNRTKLNNDISKLQNISLAIFNLDNFRQINDFYGHEFGNKIIISIANKIHSLIFDDENLRFYRLQGDEFVILSTSYSKYAFESVAKSVLISINESINIDEEQILTSCSCGISFEDKEHILSSANMALKIAKRSNSNLLVYNEDISLNNEYKNNLHWAKKLSDAIKKENIITYYQPIVNNSNLVHEKYESLVRMRDEDKIIAPIFFLEVAKQTRQYFDITKAVIRQSFEMFKDKDIEFSINLSIKDILEVQIFNYILTMLQEYNIGQKVVFEIVESESIENFEGVINFINQVKKYNCKIAIDDFGTGYSNFEYLIKLKADYLKIDGSLIKNLDKDKNAFIVVSTIVEFSKKLGMKTIAEFVENEEIFKIVREMGIDYSQGYYFSAAKESLA
ncbi:MAG: EAL domain-containing protein [Sulfurimonas sp.]|uniref:EAL domain-containing protein n=1 Tax=Sulfurimonas sp. TaxID=2022749 RepID=UPI00261DFA5A|nr:EAL domain-containing protein [Sulfurimonas sp.]MDD5399615.1 EAL domain-containing protein [Sulfurimonas sp.]